MTINEPGRFDSVGTEWNRVASFRSYEDAQVVVDRLSDDDFPVKYLDIVGVDLRTVERVTGRLTKGKAAAVGAVTGGWVGLFIGLLVGLFAAPPLVGFLVTGLAIGAVWGAVAGYAGHASTGGRRDFSSMKTLVAMRYELIARGGTVARARQMLQAAGLITKPEAHAGSTSR